MNELSVRLCACVCEEVWWGLLLFEQYFLWHLCVPSACGEPASTPQKHFMTLVGSYGVVVVVVIFFLFAYYCNQFFRLSVSPDTSSLFTPVRSFGNAISVVRTSGNMVMCVGRPMSPDSSPVLSSCVCASPSLCGSRTSKHRERLTFLT